MWASLSWFLLMAGCKRDAVNEKKQGAWELSRRRGLRAGSWWCWIDAGNQKTKAGDGLATRRRREVCYALFTPLHGVPALATWSDSLLWHRQHHELLAERLAHEALNRNHERQQTQAQRAERRPQAVGPSRLAAQVYW